MIGREETCSRCSLQFYASHGNQTICATCRTHRPNKLRFGMKRTYGERYCDRCSREFLAVSDNQRFCSPQCRRLGRRREEAKYATTQHRGTRRQLAPIVAQGWVRCARGAACKRAELVNGVLTGGIIEPGEKWHLGHPDSESVGGPEHVGCNCAAPSRLRARVSR